MKGGTEGEGWTRAGGGERREKSKEIEEGGTESPGEGRSGLPVTAVHRWCVLTFPLCTHAQLQCRSAGNAASRQPMEPQTWWMCIGSKNDMPSQTGLGKSTNK